MEIVQVLIFMVIIAIAIVQQITKLKRKRATPSPREVLTDMFPTIEETEEEEQTISPRPIKCAPRPIRKKKEKPLSAPIANENTRHTPSDEKKRIALNTREEARRAFIYSEIFQSKILITTILTTRKHIEYHGI